MLLEIGTFFHAFLIRALIYSGYSILPTYAHDEDISMLHRILTWRTDGPLLITIASLIISYFSASMFLNFGAIV